MQLLLPRVLTNLCVSVCCAWGGVGGSVWGRVSASMEGHVKEMCQNVETPSLELTIQTLGGARMVPCHVLTP